MLNVVRGVLATALVAILAVAIQAQEKKPVPAKDPNAGQFAFPKQIKLDDKQKEQQAKLQAEYSPKLTELAGKQSAVIPADRVKAATAARNKASEAILTPERVKAAKEAQKKAQDAGKKGKELTQAYQDALKLTEDEQKKIKGLNKVYEETLAVTAEEKKQIAEINQQRNKLLKEIGEKKLAILTAEQKELLKPKPKTDK